MAASTNAQQDVARKSYCIDVASLLGARCSMMFELSNENYAGFNDDIKTLFNSACMCLMLDMYKICVVYGGKYYPDIVVG